MNYRCLFVLISCLLLVGSVSALTEWTYSTATASSTYTTRYPTNLIDHNLATIWDGYSLDSNNAWAQIDYGAGNSHPVSYYAIYGNANPSSYFTSWRFLGSNDGITFTLLDSETGQTAGATATWSNFTVSQTGNISNFRYYRVAFSAFSGPEPILGEINLLGNDNFPPVAAFTPNGTQTGVGVISVSFTDISTGSPTDYNWTYQGIVAGNNTLTQFATSRDVNASFTVGNYTVKHGVNNSYGSNITPTGAWVNVSAYPFAVNFHADITTPAIDQVVTFTDDTTGSPDGWYWDFNDGNTSTLQNPTHVYAWAGVFSVNLSANSTTSQGWMNKSNYITVHGPQGFNQVDLTMDQQFTLTLNMVDSSTNLPIPVVLVIDSLGNNQTTSTGTFTGTYTYSTVVLYLTSSGYDGKSAAYIMDSDRVETVQMTKSITSQTNSNLNVLYPHEVQFTLVDSGGHSLSNVNVTAIMMSSSIENTNWYTTLFGISTQATSVNSTTLYAVSDDSGSFAMPMVSSGRYTMTFTSVAKGISESRTISPQQANYVFVLNPTASLIPNKGDYINGTLYQTEPNSSYVDLKVDYIDIGHTTTSMMFFVNDGTTGVRLYTKIVSGYIGNSSHSVANIASTSYVWGYYADSTTFGNVSEAQGIMMKGATGKMFNLDPCGGYATGWGNEC